MNYSMIVFLLIFLGLLTLFGITPQALFKQKAKPFSIGADIFSAKRSRIAGKRRSWFETHKSNVELAIRAGELKLKWPQYLEIVLVVGALGIVLGIIFNNALLSVSMAICLPCLPYQFLRLRSAGCKAQLLRQTETAIAIITNSYLQNKDIGAAVKASIPGAEQPLKSILQEFATNLLFGENVASAISVMRSQVDSFYWREWCDRLIQCQDNSSMRTLLPPLIDQLATVREVQEELDTQMADIWREHIMISCIVLGSIPLMRLLNAEWYVYLVSTIPGKIAVSMTFVVSFFATLYVLRVNKPVSSEV